MNRGGRRTLMRRPPFSHFHHGHRHTYCSGGRIMKLDKAWFRHVRTAAHAATLVFSLFWLVATSSDAVPAEECFTGLSNPTMLAVVLGTPAGDQSTQTGTVSCGGIDGLVP